MPLINFFERVEVDSTLTPSMSFCSLCIATHRESKTKKNHERKRNSYDNWKNHGFLLLVGVATLFIHFVEKINNYDARVVSTVSDNFINLCLFLSVMYACSCFFSAHTQRTFEHKKEKNFSLLRGIKSRCENARDHTNVNVFSLN